MKCVTFVIRQQKHSKCNFNGKKFKGVEIFFKKNFPSVEQNCYKNSERGIMSSFIKIKEQSKCLPIEDWLNIVCCAGS